MSSREISVKSAPVPFVASVAGAADGLWSWIVLRALRGLRHGGLRLTLPDGRSLRVDGDDEGPEAEINIIRPRALRRLALGGDIGFGEAYVDGDWDSPNLAAVIELAARNRQSLVERLEPRAGLRGIGRLLHALHGNSRRGSRRNIAAHYDLGNAFYEAWLDPSMTYSAALFEAEAEDLEIAQRRKYRRICEQLALQPGQHVLEIGCGWGGFAEVAAGEFGAQVTGITLSREQLAYAEARMAAQGLSRQVTLQYRDYRDLDGRFDHIVSIEMVEAVGESYWPGYFQVLARCLKPGGRAALQSILIDAAHFEGYRRSPDFIQRYVFPGGMLPTRDLLVGHAERAGLTLADELLFGIDYAETLARWRAEFEDNWSAIRALRFDDRFRRLWRYYLAYCEGGFRGRAIDVGQFTLVRPA